LRDPDSLLDQLYHRILVDAFGKLRKDKLACQLQLLYPFSMLESLCQHYSPPTFSSGKTLMKLTQCSLIPLLQMRFLTAFTQSFTLNVTRFFHTTNPFLTSYLILLALGSFGVAKQSTINASPSLASGSWRGCDSTLPISHYYSSLTVIIIPAGGVDKNISAALSYSCQNWDYHLSGTKSTPYEPLHKTLSEFMPYSGLKS